eukprot:gene32506-40115_t
MRRLTPEHSNHPQLARAIDGLRVVTLTKASKAGDWPAVWEPLMVLLRQNGEELAPEALDGLLAWAVQPDPGAVLELALPVHLMVKRLKAMSHGLRHAAACPAESHAQCPSFQRLLKAAAAGALERKQRSLKTVAGARRKHS